MAQPSDNATVDPVISAYVVAAAEVLGLRLHAEQRPGVERQFARLAALARLVEEHPLDCTDEPAPFFHPGTRR
ncbi:MAG TPA: DUF4089 domain-containing protein [Casimicrobiaceae bacterium]|nr:DUF4089 domain-containing protein [Casimicrobiaceae bacterium]